MKKGLLYLFFLSLGQVVFSQQWVDTLYTISDTTVEYGQAVDFAGNLRTLEMDVSHPTNDIAPACGRPLMVLVHGGAFMAGSKEDAEIVRMRKDFAKRGYVTAAINYRLGMFQVSSDWHCNITYFDGVEWDCLNQSDTLEWYRAYYRGIQDTRGAIRYLVNHYQEWNIDPNNVFVTGASAGAFIALGVGYLDDPNERPAGTSAINAVNPPNVRYESLCVQQYQLDTNIASMQLARPDLGGIEGDLNPSSIDYKIRGVGDFFGGMFMDLFNLNVNPAEIPALYVFHQPADLIVPHTYNRLFAGYSWCASQFPFNCAGILNRPYCHGGRSIRDMVDARVGASLPAPVMLATITTNNADCATQIGNPSLGGHQVDNYWNRTSEMALFFADKVDTSTTCITGLAEFQNGRQISIFPNPAHGRLSILAGGQIDQIELMDMTGRVLLQRKPKVLAFDLEIPEAIQQGWYFIRVSTGGTWTSKMILIQDK